jgi:hypothetical protein
MVNGSSVLKDFDRWTHFRLLGPCVDRIGVFSLGGFVTFDGRFYNIVTRLRTKAVCGLDCRFAGQASDYKSGDMQDAARQIFYEQNAVPRE